jgi:pyruvate formate lyase activating enzyme
MTSGVVFNIQRYSIHDGPGIRTTVFLKGCPLDCWWCHNPESRSAKPEVLVVEGRCIRCGACTTACPRPSGGEFQESARCTRCGACVAACPTGARQLVGQRMTVAEVLAEVLKDRMFYDDSRGGVTISGGEPLMQPLFLMELLAECRRERVHVALDTAGFAAWETLAEVAALVDLFLYDLKLLDDAEHERYTGVSNGSILENLVALGGVHNQIWVRIPLIPGVNDEPTHLEAMARFVADVAGVHRVCLLPYHKAGIHKAQRCGCTPRLDDTSHPTPEALGRASECFTQLGLMTTIGG